jgi:hypothetical protein
MDGTISKLSGPTNRAPEVATTKQVSAGLTRTLDRFFNCLIWRALQPYPSPDNKMFRSICVVYTLSFIGHFCVPFLVSLFRKKMCEQIKIKMVGLKRHNLTEKKLSIYNYLIT